MNFIACLFPLTLCLDPSVLNSNGTDVNSTVDNYNTNQSLSKPITGADSEIVKQLTALNDNRDIKNQTYVNLNDSNDGSTNTTKVELDFNKGLSIGRILKESSEGKYSSNGTNFEFSKNRNRQENKGNYSKASGGNSTTLNSRSSVVSKSPRVHKSPHNSRQTNEKDLSSKDTDENVYSSVDQRFKNRPLRNQRNKHRRMRHRHRLRFLYGNKKHPIKTTIYGGDVSNNPFLSNQFIRSNFWKKSRKGGRTNKNCPSCRGNGLTEEKVRQLRIKKFIETFAEKLRTTPDKLMASGRKRSPPKLPSNIIEETLQDNNMQQRDDGFYAKDLKVTIAGSDLGRKNCFAKPTSGCYKFDLEGKIKGDVASAELWVYKTPDTNDSSVQTFILYGLEKMGSRQMWAHNQLQRFETHVREGWVVINMTRSVSSWVRQRKNSEMIAIRCSTCSTRNYKALYGIKHGYKPLIIIKYDSNSFLRGRRSIDENCDPDIECCKRSLEINFRNIRMVHIEAPPDLAVGYCYGSCNANLIGNNYAYNHTMLKQRKRYVDSNTSADLVNKLKPCCVPIVLKHAMVFVRQGYSGMAKMVPNVIVERCGCV